MKPEPKIDNCNLSRPAHRLRTKRHAQIRLTTSQKLITPTRYGADRLDAGNASTELSPTDPVQLVRQIRSKASKPPQSP